MLVVISHTVIPKPQLANVLAIPTVPLASFIDNFIIYAAKLVTQALPAIVARQVSMNWSAQMKKGGFLFGWLGFFVLFFCFLLLL